MKLAAAWIALLAGPVQETRPPPPPAAVPYEEAQEPVAVGGEKISEPGKPEPTARPKAPEPRHPQPVPTAPRQRAPYTGEALIVTSVPTLAIGLTALAFVPRSHSGQPLWVGLLLAPAGVVMLTEGILLAKRYRKIVRETGLEPPWSGATLLALAPWVVAGGVAAVLGPGRSSDSHLLQTPLPIIGISAAGAVTLAFGIRQQVRFVRFWRRHEHQPAGSQGARRHAPAGR